MTRETFDKYIKAHEQAIDEIRLEAWTLHASVGQTYDHTLPYGHHLSMVANTAVKYGYSVVAKESDILPVIFAAFYHDSIEDARLTYNDLKKIAKHHLNDEQTIMADEIVYALTNDKGRTREERAGEHYYAGIRKTPYAPFVKLCDRLANMTYSFQGTNQANQHMHEVYQTEWPHFLESIHVNSTDSRFALPTAMITEITNLFGSND